MTTLQKQIKVQTVASIFANSKTNLEAVNKISDFLVGTYGTSAVDSQLEAVRLVKAILKTRSIQRLVQ